MLVSLVNEKWEYTAKGVEDGCPVVYVAREKYDYATRLTIFKLMKKNDVWYNVGQWISKGQFRTHHFGSSDAKVRPLRLSDSRIDVKLRKIAEENA